MVDTDYHFLAAKKSIFSFASPFKQRVEMRMQRKIVKSRFSYVTLYPGTYIHSAPANLYVSLIYNSLRFAYICSCNDSLL